MIIYAVKGLQKKRSQVIPNSIERKEPSKAEIFAISIVAAFLKARVAIKMDMVKPMPAKSPAPIICRHEVFAGNVPHLHFTVIKQAVKIPNGLPITKPATIPTFKVVLIAPAISPGKSMAVLAKANMGIIIKLTGVCKACSSFASLSVGINNATITPAIVACIPEL